jgi:hypothetical protein
VPPLTVILIAPFEFEQVADVGTPDTAKAADGCVTILEVLATQPFASVTVTLKLPGASPDMKHL